MEREIVLERAFIIRKNRGKKMKIRKWSFLIMLVTVLALILAACGGEGEEVPGDNGSEQNNENNGNNEQENAEAPEETYDLGGRTIKIEFQADWEPTEGSEMGDLT